MQRENSCLAQSGGFGMSALCSGALCLYQTGLLPAYLWLIPALRTKNVKRKTISVCCEFRPLCKCCPLSAGLCHQVGQLM